MSKKSLNMSKAFMRLWLEARVDALGSGEEAAGGAGLNQVSSDTSNHGGVESTTGNGNKRSTERTNWSGMILSVLDAAMKLPDAEPFRRPLPYKVSRTSTKCSRVPNLYPNKQAWCVTNCSLPQQLGLADYAQIVGRRMDLGTVKQRLLEGKVLTWHSQLSCRMPGDL